LGFSGLAHRPQASGEQLHMNGRTAQHFTRYIYTPLVSHVTHTPAATVEDARGLKNTGGMSHMTCTQRTSLPLPLR